MSASEYKYYIGENPAVGSDILRAAIHSEVEGFSLQVFSRAADGGVVHHVCSRSVGAGAKAPAEARLAERPGSTIGLAAALGAALACSLFLPLLYSLGRWPFACLVFLGTLIAAWAGRAFSLPGPSTLIRRRLKKLKPEQLLIVCHGAEAAQQGIHQILSRYSVVPMSEPRQGSASEKGADSA